MDIRQAAIKVCLFLVVSIGDEVTHLVLSGVHNELWAVFQLEGAQEAIILLPFTHLFSTLKMQ